MAKKLKIKPKKTAKDKTVKSSKDGFSVKVTSTKKNGKKAALSLLEQLESRLKIKHGDEIITRLVGEPKNVKVAFSTGVPQLDDALGVGGYPSARIVEIYGAESSGKTTLTLHAIAECQKAGGTAAFIDAEHALDVKYAKDLGVDVNSLLVSQPDYGEQALQITQDLLGILQEMSSDKPNIIVIDSVAALTPKSEIDGEIGEGGGVGEQARMMSKALRKLCIMVAKTNTVLIFINQTRDRISFGYGPSKTTTGGNALKFYASIRIEVKRIGSEKAGEQILGNKTKVKITKNKVAPPFKEFEALIRFGVGFDLSKAKYDALCKLPSVIKKKPAWVTLPDDRKFCGYKGFLDFYDENSEYIDGLLKGDKGIDDGEGE